MNEPTRGMTVVGSDGQLGLVDEVIYESTGEAARVLVQRNDGQNMVLQPGAYRVEDGVVYLAGESRFATERLDLDTSAQTRSDDMYRTQRIGQVGSLETLDVGDNQSAVIPVVREELRISRREVVGGGVRVHKRVEEREEVVEQPTYREEVSVERVTLGQPIDQAIGSRQEGDTLIIPVLEEMLVVEKRLVLKEEIRITRRRIEETEQVRVMLREEQVDIEELGDASSVA